jgi:hypothetical protein
MSDTVTEGLKKVPGVDPRIGQRTQAFSSLNEGPAAIGARAAGLVQEAPTNFDDSPYCAFVLKPELTRAYCARHVQLRSSHPGSVARLQHRRHPLSSTVTFVPESRRS